MSNSTHTLGCIGATYKTRPQSLHREEKQISVPARMPVQSASFLDFHNRVAHLSETHLRNVRSLEVQRRGERCIGLKITRDDGQVEVLGQWNPSAVDSIAIIHSGQQPSLRTLSFVLSGQQHADNGYQAFAKDILAYASTDTETPTVVWNDLKKVCPNDLYP